MVTDCFLRHFSAFLHAFGVAGFLAALVGTRVVGAISVLVSALIFERLAEIRFGTRARPAALVFAVGAAGDLYIGRLTFALGVENAGMQDLRIVADGFQDGVPGYHTNTYGHLAGELARRVDGRLPGTWLRDTIAGPLDADLAWGIDAATQQRCA